MNVKYHFFRSSYSSQFFVLSGIAFVSNIAYTMTSILFAIFANNIGLDIKQIGLIISAMTLGALISGPIWGKIVDRTGKRKLVLLLCLTGQGVFCLLTPFMKNFLPLFLARFFFGFFLVAQAPILNEIIIKNRDPEMRGKKLSFINIIRGVAYSFAVILSGFMIDLNPLLNFVLSGTAALAMLYPTWKLKEIDGMEPRSPEVKSSTTWILKMENLTFFFPILLRSAAVNGLAFFIPLFWKGIGHSATFIGIVLGISNLFQLAFFPFAGRVCSSSPRVTTRIIQLGYILTIVPFLVAPFVYRGASVFIPQTVLSISWVFFSIGSTLLLGHIAPLRQRAEAMGWMESAFNLGGTIGPSAFSLVLSGTHNNFTISFLSFSLLLVASIFIFRWYKKRYLPV